MAAASPALSAPAGNLITGNLTEFSRDPLGFVTQCSRGYGDIVPMRFLHRRNYLFLNPRDIETILGPCYRDTIKTIGLRTPTMRLLLGNGLVTSEGDFWARQRRLEQPAFHRQRIDSYAKTMVTLTERMLTGWSDGEVRDLHQDMMRLTLEIAAKTLFNADAGPDADEAGAALQVMMNEFPSQWGPTAMLDAVLRTPTFRRFRSAVQRLDVIVLRIIGERRASGRDDGDLLSMLLQAQDEDGSQMTDRQLRDEVVTFFFAGHETTALALSWAWFLLSENPEVEACVLGEIRSVLGGRAPTLADLPSLAYTERVVKETMRLYPPVWAIGREAIKPMEVGGQKMPVGTSIMFSQWVTHRDPRWWDRADEFLPERWESDPLEKGGKYAYFPFGGGPRGCIGLHFAMMEAVLLLATIAQRFQFSLLPGYPVIPFATMSLRPKDGVRVRVRKRTE